MTLLTLLWKCFQPERLRNFVFNLHSFTLIVHIPLVILRLFQILKNSENGSWLSFNSSKKNVSIKCSKQHQYLISPYEKFFQNVFFIKIYCLRIDFHERYIIKINIECNKFNVILSLGTQRRYIEILYWNTIPRINRYK